MLAACSRRNVRLYIWGDVWASNSLINVGNKEYSADTIIVADENLASDNSAVVGIAMMYRTASQVLQ